MEQTLLDLERTPTNMALTDTAFRALHTIKGSGAMFGFNAVASFTRHVTVGIRADKVHEVTEAAAAALQETSRIGTSWRPGLIRCTGKRGADFMVMLDIKRVFSSGLQHDASAPDGH